MLEKIINLLIPNEETIELIYNSHEITKTESILVALVLTVIIYVMIENIILFKELVNQYNDAD